MMVIEYLKNNFDEFFDNFMLTYYYSGKFETTEDIFSTVFLKMGLHTTDSEVAEIADMYDTVGYQLQDDSYDNAREMHKVELLEALNQLGS